MKKPAEQVVIITGASGNLGVATARTFQARGYKTVLMDRAPDRLIRTFEDLAGSDRHLLYEGVDLSSSESIERLMSEIEERFGNIDILVNTVGAWRAGRPVHEAPLEDWDFLLGANLRTTLVACRAVIPKMIPQQYGRIINVASRDGLAGSARAAAYSASKSAVIRLTESLAEELKGFGITVNCVLPGTIDTPQNRAAIPNADFSKWVEPSALAEVIHFLASDAARAVTGAALPVYGKS